jgi:hypothetical protein
MADIDVSALRLAKLQMLGDVQGDASLASLSAIKHENRENPV